MLKTLKSFVKATPLAIPFIWAKGRITKPAPQNDEALILETLLRRFDIPKCFIEFGFGGWEFNCASLAYDWQGLLLDGDKYNKTIANIILPKRVEARQLWITRESLFEIKDWANGKDIGILSIDVDGNDYWFWKELLFLKPAMLIAEYNSTFGLRPLTVPYHPEFDRRKTDMEYFGASLTALARLFEGYSLIEITNTGVNAFFIRNDLIGKHDRPLDPEAAYRESPHEDGSRPEERWEKIKHLAFVTV